MPSTPGLLVDLEISEAGLNRLQQAPRESVEGTLKYVQDGRSMRVTVRVHLKGSKGSFQSVLERPSLTLEFPPDARFFGLRKVHLNNAVEDPSLWNERLSAELFAQAGVPVARSGHAVVVLNGKALGLYVIKEGFEWELFERFFQDATGVVYEPKMGNGAWWEWMKGRGVQLQDVTDGVEPGAADTGGPSLQVLGKGVETSSWTNRWARFSSMLDLDSWSSFMAVEMLVAHRDGYCFAHNNFKIFWHAAGKKWWFVPHGMDQVLGGIQIPWDARMAGPLAESFMGMPEGQALVRGRLKALHSGHLTQVRVERWIRRWEAELVPALSTSNRRLVSAGARDVVERFRKRWKFLEEDLERRPVAELRFEGEGMEQPILGWERNVGVGAGAGGDGALRESPDLYPAQSRWTMEVSKEWTGNWKVPIRLRRGKYRVQGRLETRDWVKMETGRFQGTRLRIEDGLGNTLGQTETVMKMGVGGKRVELNFEVTEGEPVVLTLIWEARGQRGVAAMLGAPRIMRLP